MTRIKHLQIQLNIIFFLSIILFLVLFQKSQAQVYNTYRQGSSNSAGSHYVPPVVTKSYGTAPTGNVYSTAPAPSTSGSSSATYFATPGASNYLYRSSWNRRLGRQQMKLIKEAQAKEAESMEWKKQADAVVRNFKMGNFAAAEEIRRSIYQWPPRNFGEYLIENYPDPSLDRNFYEYDLKYKRAYHYICILLLAELKDYEQVKFLYWRTFSDGTLKNPSAKTKFTYDTNDYYYTYNHQHQSATLAKAFSDLSYSDILKLESAFLEAYSHDNGIQAARIRWTEISEFYFPYVQYKVTDISQKSLCFNILSMTNLQLGLYEEAIIYSKKQLAFHPDLDYLQFSAYQNLLEFILSSSQQNKMLVDYCIDGFEALLGRADEKNFNSEFLYQIKYSLANLFQINGEYEKAEALLNSQVDIEEKHLFPHSILKYNIASLQLKKVNDLMLQADETKALKEKSIPNETPEQRKIYDSLYTAGYFDMPNENFYETMIPIREKLQSSHDVLLAISNTTSNFEQSEEMQIVFAENNIRQGNLENAKSNYEIAIIGNEDNWTLQLRLAEINSMMKNDAEAIKILTETIALNPNEYQLDLTLADIYRNTGQAKNAKKFYQLAYSKGAFLSDEIAAFLNTK